MRGYTLKLLGILAVANVAVWAALLLDRPPQRPEAYFFDVGQGDSEMVRLPGGATVLVDGGPDRTAVKRIEQVLPWHDRRIDVVVLSHAHPDHFTGLVDVAKRYDIGVFLYNGEGSAMPGFRELWRVLKDRHVPIVAMGKGSSLRHGTDVMEVLASRGCGEREKKDANEGSLVMRFATGNASALFTGDIGKDTEGCLVREGVGRVDVMKMSHHGSKFSSTEGFMRRTRPKLAIVEVGKNAYGHPTKEAMGRAASIGAKIMRTDADGTIRLVFFPDRIGISAAEKDSMSDILTKK